MLPFLWRRATRIYPLYWIFTIIQLSAILLIPSVTDRVITTENIVASFLLLPQTVYPILAPGWTLVYEMFFYLVFALLFFIPKRFSLHFLSAWAGVTICLYAIQTTDGMSNTTDLLQLPIYASPMNLEFLAGCLVGFASTNRINRLGTVSLVIGTLWFLSGSILVKSLTDASAEFGFTRVIVFGIASALILYGLVTLEQNGVDNNKHPGVIGGWLIAVGDASYSLYLSHLLVINVFAMIWARLSLQGLVVQALFEIAMLVTCISSAIITYRVVELPLLDRMRDRHRKSDSTIIAVGTNAADN